jgi:lipopolysaccharide/colanic/teichoic acid biosynthesis glycosyltransferase
MGVSKFETDVFLQNEEYTPQQWSNSLSLKDHRKSMFLARYVSSWCMSKRKRCFDLVLSVLALILFSPVMLLIGWLIKLTSQGPALFRQERVGLHQRPFVIFKFRTMKHSCEQPDRGSKVTKQGDPRMTSLGSLLRRLKLDELPQLINVARGEMSFVGPRPKIPQHETLCMLCRPGITGAATLVFSHEESLLVDIPVEFVERYVTSTLNPEKCRLDSNYIETARFGTDMTILIRTVFRIGNRHRSIWTPQAAAHLHESSPIRRSVSVSMMGIETSEVSTQEA